MGADAIVAIVSSFGSATAAVVATWLAAKVMKMADQKVSALAAQLRAENDRDLAIASFAKAELELEATKVGTRRVVAALEEAHRKLRDYEAKAIADAGGDDLLDVADRVLAGEGLPADGPPTPADPDHPP